MFVLFCNISHYSIDISWGSQAVFMDSSSEQPLLYCCRGKNFMTMYLVVHNASLHYNVMMLDLTCHV